MIKNCYVEIVVAGGSIMTNRVDFLDAAIIARGATLQGWAAAILNWTPAAGQIWTDRFLNHECTIARIAPGGRPVMALVPFGIPVTLATGEVDVEVFLDEATLEKPLHWKRPRRIFVCSMTDLFGSWVTVEMLDRIYDVMAACPQHTFQVLTKRPERMHRYYVNLAERVAQVPNNPVRFPLANLWAGVTIESQAYEDRLEELLKTPAAVRFVSVEPLLAPLDLGLRNWADLGRDDCRLDWVIVGGESGRQRTVRPMHPDWVRLIRDDCQAAGVPFFFKQWGEWAPLEKHHVMVPSGNYAFLPSGDKVVPEHDTRKMHVWPHRAVNGAECFSAVKVGKVEAGRLLDGREWNEFPEAVPCT